MSSVASRAGSAASSRASRTRAACGSPSASVSSLQALGCLAAALADSDLGIALGYSIAGAAALSGALLTFIPWLDTGVDAERLRIEQGLGPRISRIAPWLGPTGSGLTIAGTM